MKIFVYAEGGHYLGLGNVYRMLSLINALKNLKSEIEFTFLTTSGNEVEDLLNKYLMTSFVSLDDLEELTNFVVEKQPDIVIVDVLNISENFVKNLKEQGQMALVLFGNDNESNRYADLVVNAILSTVNFQNEDYKDEHRTRYLKGPKYLAIRDEFTPDSYTFRNNLQNVLLMFGGTDQANFSYKVLSDLLHDSKTSSLNFSLVLGAGFLYFHDVQSLADLPNVHILSNIDNVSEVMLQNDFLITSAGTSYFEALYLGVPSIALFQNDSQKKVFGNFFHTYDYQTIKPVGQFVIDIYQQYATYTMEAKALGVGIGKNEILEAILNLRK